MTMRGSYAYRQGWWDGVLGQRCGRLHYPSADYMAGFDHGRCRMMQIERAL